MNKNDCISPKIITLTNSKESPVRIQFYKTNSYFTLGKESELKLYSNLSSEISYFEKQATLFGIQFKAEEVKEDVPPNPSTVAEVSNLTELKAAASDSNITTVNLNKDITKISEVITFSNSITFNGNNHKLSFSVTGQNLIFLAGGTISGLTVESTISDKEIWSSTYTTQVYNGDYSISNCKFTGGNGGLLVNASTATITGTVDVSGNGFGGIEVSKGKAGTIDPSLTVSGSITNTTEAYKKPTIWIDGEVGTVTASNMTEVEIDNQKQYYLNEENSKETVVSTK